jgi:hypothetical protein
VTDCVRSCGKSRSMASSLAANDSTGTYSATGSGPGIGETFNRSGSEALVYFNRNMPITGITFFEATALIVDSCLWRIVIWPSHRAETLLHPLPYVIDFKRALNFGEAQVALHEHENHIALSPRVIWLTGIFCGSRVLGTDMRYELLVALLFVVRHHLDN